MRRPRLLGRSADFADRHGRVGAIVGAEQLERVEERRTDYGVAADAEARRLPQPGVGHRLDRLVRQRAGPTDDAHPGPRDGSSLG